MTNNYAKLIFLGTGDAHVTKCYNTCFIYEENSHYFLTDAGGGNQILVNLEKAGIDLNKIHDFFISHSHTDHILGAIWVIRLYCAAATEVYPPKDIKGMLPLNIYGSSDVIQKLRKICEAVLQKNLLDCFDKLILFNIINDGFRLDFYGSSIKFFDTESLSAPQMGFEILIPNEKRLVFCGDEKYRLPVDSYIHNSDWCIYENTSIFYNPVLARNHSCTEEGAKLAEAAGVKNLILTHTEDHDMKNRKETVIREAAKFFSGNIYCPYDLETIDL
jgi:ribonuclease Z